MAGIRLVHRRNPNVVVVVDEEKAANLALMGYSPEESSSKAPAKKPEKKRSSK